METMLREQIVSHMMENSLFCDEQHGFVPGRSCMTQLLITIELWTELLDTGTALDVIYLDFKKAFDSVPHKRLLSKLDAYGIGGPIKEWIKSFLMNRKQRVTVNGIMSSWSEVLSGIPCFRPYIICYIHKRLARCSDQYHQDICGRHQIV